MHSESVRPCQHDRCPCRLVCQIYGTDMLLLLRGHILSIQTIDSIPTYCARSTLANSPPHTETQRDPSRPPGQRGLQTSHHGAQQIHSIAPAHCCSSRPRQRLTDCPSPVEPLPPFPPSTAARPVCTRPCISQTSSPSSKHSRPAGLLAELAAGLGLKRLAAHLKRRLFWGSCSLPLAILDESQIAKQPPASTLCGTLTTLSTTCAAVHWLPFAAALPHHLRWILASLASRIDPARGV
jgi:hypothetical protein